MRNRHHVCLRMLIFSAVSWIPSAARATQIHAQPEGLYVHQLGHALFFISMGILIYWLRGRQLTSQKGWQYLQYAAAFFMLWNLDAAGAHFLEAEGSFFLQLRPGTWQAVLVAKEGHQWKTLLYYLAKMDHLLCVPAIIFLYMALRQFYRNANRDLAP